MVSTERTILHLPFFEALADSEESSAEWRTRSAGLVVLRLFDAWVNEGRSVVAADSWGLRAVREAIAAIDARSSIRAILQSVVDTIESAGSAEVPTVAPRLLAYARALQFDADWALAADVYRTVLAHAHPMEDCDIAVTANMQLGSCLRMLADWQGASAAYSTAGSIATISGDLMNVLRSRIAEANLAIDRGNLPQAELMLDETIAQANRSGLQEVKAVALHDRAAVAHLRGKFELAVQLGYEALRGYREQVAKDRVLADIAGSFTELGLRSAARDAYLILAATAQEQYTRWLATVNLLEIAALDGSEPVFEQYRRELADASLPASLAVYYHLFVGQGYRMFHKPEQAEAALGRAIEIASTHKLNQVLIRAERSLQELRNGGVIIIAASAEPSSDVAGVAGAIRELRALAGVAG
jgi:hypothetical protein